MENGIRCEREWSWVLSVTPMAWSRRSPSHFRLSSSAEGDHKHVRRGRGYHYPPVLQTPAHDATAASANECASTINDVHFSLTAIRLNLLLRSSPAQVNSRRKSRFILQTNAVSFKSLFHKPYSGLLWAVGKNTVNLWCNVSKVLGQLADYI